MSKDICVIVDFGYDFCQDLKRYGKFLDYASNDLDMMRVPAEFLAGRAEVGENQEVYLSKRDRKVADAFVEGMEELKKSKIVKGVKIVEVDV